eukprot:10567115-Alexandrium_andersonii.AAC.1
MMPPHARWLANQLPVNNDPSANQGGSISPAPPALDPRTHHFTHGGDPRVMPNSKTQGRAAGGAPARTPILGGLSSVSPEGPHTLGSHAAQRGVVG